MIRRRGTHLQAEVGLPPGFVLPSAALVPSSPKPTGETRAGDLRYNILVRLGNLGCTCPVDHLETEALTEYWELHTPAGQNGIRQWLAAEGCPELARDAGSCASAAMWAERAERPRILDREDRPVNIEVMPYAGGPVTFGRLLSRDEILASEGWIEVTTMGSRRREWLPPPASLRGSAFEILAPVSRCRAEPDCRAGGPSAGELAEKITSRSCADCGMHDEPCDGSGRCRFCAELAALRPKVVILPAPPRRRISVGILPALAIVLLLMVLAVGIGLLLSWSLR